MSEFKKYYRRCASREKRRQGIFSKANKRNWRLASDELIAAFVVFFCSLIVLAIIEVLVK